MRYGDYDFFIKSLLVVLNWLLWKIFVWLNAQLPWYNILCSHNSILIENPQVRSEIYCTSFEPRIKIRFQTRIPNREKLIRRVLLKIYKLGSLSEEFDFEICRNSNGTLRYWLFLWQAQSGPPELVLKLPWYGRNRIGTTSFTWVPCVAKQASLVFGWRNVWRSGNGAESAAKETDRFDVELGEWAYQWTTSY